MARMGGSLQPVRESRRTSQSYRASRKDASTWRTALKPLTAPPARPSNLDGQIGLTLGLAGPTSPALSPG